MLLFPPNKNVLPPVPPARIQVFLKRIKKWLLSPVSTKRESFGAPRLALLFAVLLVLFQVGLEMFGIQQNFVFGLVCWLAIIGLCIYIVWVWERTAHFTVLAKLLSSIVVAAVIVVLIWSPAKKQYRREHPVLTLQPGTQISRLSGKAMEAEKQSAAAEAEAARKAKDAVHNLLAKDLGVEGQTATRVFTLTVLPPNTPLKGRALLLSENILEFVVERNEKAPPYPEPETWARDQETVRAYNAETMKLFMTDHAARVNSIRDELALKGLRDPGLDQLYEHPANVHGMRVIAEKIADLAQRLPSPAGVPKVMPNPISPRIGTGPDTFKQPSGEIQSGLTIKASIVDPASPAIVVENTSDYVAQGVIWELVVFRARDLDFISLATQSIGFVKAHSRSAPYGMFSPGIPRITTDKNNVPMGDADIRVGDSLTGSLVVDCPDCAAVTYIVHFDWGQGGWYAEMKQMNGRFPLPKDMSSEGKQRYITGLDLLIPAKDKIPFSKSVNPQ